MLWSYYALYSIICSCPAWEMLCCHHCPLAFWLHRNKAHYSWQPARNKCNYTGRTWQTSQGNWNTAAIALCVEWRQHASRCRRPVVLLPPDTCSSSLHTSSPSCNLLPCDCYFLLCLGAINYRTNLQLPYLSIHAVKIIDEDELPAVRKRC